MAAKPARLTTNRHGTISLRWIVPVRLRDEHGRPREVRISLRTRDYLRARILALEFNLALERYKAMTRRGRWQCSVSCLSPARPELTVSAAYRS